MARPCINMMAVGDAGCGKTCLLTMFLKKEFLAEHTPVNIDNHVIYIVVDGNAVPLCLYSTAGETFRRLKVVWLSRMKCNVIVFIITYRKRGK